MAIPGRKLFGSVNFSKRFKFYRKWLACFVAAGVFGSILHRKPLGPQTETGNETFAILMASIVLWISNPIPVYVTALLGPIIAVWLQVLVETGPGGNVVRIPRRVAGEMVLGYMMNGIVSVALGGFVLARALNKCLVGSTLISDLFSKHIRSGRSLCLALFILILTPMYISALIPHEAAVMVSFNLLSPVIYSVDSEIAKVILLALMLGGNLGGMLSSISTPQNILLFFSSKDLTFGGWLKVSLPVTLVAAIGVWIGLLVMWKPWRMNLTGELMRGLRRSSLRSSLDIDPESTDTKSITNDEAKAKDNMSPLMKFYTLIITLMAILLWLSARYLEDTFGGLGIVSLFPLVALFGFGILDKDDLSSLPWDIVLLAMGATTLSSICMNSGLFDIIETEFNEILGPPLCGWTRLALLCALITVSAAIKSRYIAALVYLPLAFRAIGSSPQAVGQRILVAFSCSAGMLFPISGLVNAFISQIKRPPNDHHFSSSSSDDPKNGPFIISPLEMTAVGTLGTIVSFLTIITVGYAAIKVL